MQGKRGLQRYEKAFWGMKKGGAGGKSHSAAFPCPFADSLSKK